MKSGMIFISSGIGQFPCAGCLTFSASKKFLSFLAQGLNVEFEGKIDSLNYIVGMTDTNTLKDMAKKPWFCLQPDVIADMAFRDIGYLETTKGHWKHDLPQRL